MNDEDGLLRAIIAHADEDTPRLAYADWLDEHDAPLQAGFVRAQCRHASGSAADPDYPDLIERHAELVALFHLAAKLTVPELPPGFAFDGRIDLIFDYFRRGFVYTVFPKWLRAHASPSEAEFDEFCAGLPQLIATTTARKLELVSETPEQRAHIFSAAGAEAITGLRIAGSGDEDGLARLLAGSRCAPNLERLDLPTTLTAAGMRALAAAKFDRLVRFDVPTLRGSAKDVTALTRAKWFRGLRAVEGRFRVLEHESPLVAGLGQLPHLESLTLELTQPAAIDRLGTRGAFPALAHLFLHSGKWNKDNTTKLAKARLPRLTHLRMPSVNNGAFQNMLRAPWFSQLRVLDLHTGPTSDASIIPLSKSEAAANLRILNLCDGKWEKDGLAALADGSRFPNLTTLDLATYYRRATEPELALAFVKALNLPRLRHLNLQNWPLGEAGAKALAANPAVAGLTRLSLNHCDIGERGLTALARSPHLQQLIELDLEFNQLLKAAALLDTSLLPSLAHVRLDFNDLKPAARRKLHSARGWVGYFIMEPT